MKQKKIGILSLYGNFNYGNKLQVYATQQVCSKLGYKTEIIKNSNEKEIKSLVKIIIIKIKRAIRQIFPKTQYKNNGFKEFEKNLNTTYKYYYSDDKNTSLYKKYDYFIVGSDQVWNPNFGLKGNLEFLEFAKEKTTIAFSASFGIEEIPEKMKKKYIEGINNIKHISVRENAGKKIIEKLTKRKDTKVLVDPTMLLSKEEWKKISKKPNNLQNEKFILNYFLGDLSKERKKTINEFAQKMGYKVINILDDKDPFYESGPSEFIYLEEHAELICTDSFHSCVFGILMETPFLVFDREDKNENMNSRIDTLLSKFELEDRRFDGKINDTKLKINYSKVYKILKEEQQKSLNFLKESLNYKKR